MSTRAPRSPASPKASLPKVRQAQEELRVSEERLKLALLATDTGMWEWHAGRGVRHLGESWTRLLGHPPGRLDGPGLLPEALIHAEDLPAARGSWPRIWTIARRTTKRSIGCGTGRANGAGSMTAAGWSSATRPAGRCRMIGMQTDVTDRRAAEAALVRETGARAGYARLDCGRGHHHRQPRHRRVPEPRRREPHRLAAGRGAAASRSPGSARCCTRAPGSRWRRRPSGCSTRSGPWGSPVICCWPGATAWSSRSTSRPRRSPTRRDA